MTQLRAGDRVEWNGCYAGRIQQVVGDEAVVVEHRNPLLGRTVLWRMRLAALTRIDPSRGGFPATRA